MIFHLSTGIFNRELTLAAISEGGGVAKHMFMRIKSASNGLERFSAESYMHNDHLPIGERVRVAVLLVGELSKLKWQRRGGGETISHTLGFVSGFAVDLLKHRSLTIACAGNFLVTAPWIQVSVGIICRIRITCLC